MRATTSSVTLLPDIRPGDDRSSSTLLKVMLDSDEPGQGIHSKLAEIRKRGVLREAPILSASTKTAIELAGKRSRMGDCDNASQLLLSAVEAAERGARFPEFQLANLLSALSSISAQRGKLNEAEAYLIQAGCFAETACGVLSEYSAKCLADLADLCALRLEHERALELHAAANFIRQEIYRRSN
jgi:hypothetical protein